MGKKVITTGIVYNTELTENIPAGFKDLTNEAYKDDLIMPSPLSVSYTHLDVYKRQGKSSGYVRIYSYRYSCFRCSNHR